MPIQHSRNQFITKASFARKCGVSCQKVNYWIANGIVETVVFPYIEGCEFVDTKSTDVEYFKVFNGYKERYRIKKI